MGKKIKENFRRSKLKEQRLIRLKAKLKQSTKQKENDELFKMITVDSIDSLSEKEKFDTLLKLYKLVISFPDTNSDKLKLIMLFMKDNSLKVIARTSKYLRNIFIELLPSYRLNDQMNNGNNPKVKKSKEVEALQNFEKNLCSTYEEFITSLDVLDKSTYKKENCNTFRELIIDIICELFKKFFYFNHEDKLYRILIDKLSDDLESIRKNAFKALYAVLAKVDNSKSMFELKLAMIKRISNAIFVKEHTRFEKNVLELFIAHRIEIPDIKQAKENDEKIDLKDLKYAGSTDFTTGTKADIKKKKKEYEEFKKEKSKIVKSLKKELNEIESKEDPRLIFHMNIKIIQKVLMVYFDILKHKTDSPLLLGVFTGISALCENINVEILLDLQKNIDEVIKGLVKKNKLSLAINGLKALLSIATKLTKNIVSIQDSYLIKSTYQILCCLSNEKEKKQDDLMIIFEVIEMVMLKNRMFSNEISSAFVKRLGMLCASCQKENEALSILLLIKRIISKYSHLGYLVDKDDDEGMDGFNYKNTTEPELCDGKLTTIIKELEQTAMTFKKSKMVKRVVEYIIKGEKVNMELSSLNYYEVLLAQK